MQRGPGVSPDRRLAVGARRRVPVRGGCATIADSQRQVADLAARPRDPEQRLASNATNSSRPPSANPPAAPKPVGKTPTGRKPGAQPGREPHLRRRLPPERLAAVIDFRPERCRGGHAAPPESPGANDPEPTWHRVAELSPLAAPVTGYRGHTRTGPRCGVLNHAAIPARFGRHGAGPRLTAFLA